MCGFGVRYVFEQIQAKWGPNSSPNDNGHFNFYDLWSQNTTKALSRIWLFPVNQKEMKSF